MKRLILFSMVCLMATVTQAQTDSIKIETLPEVVVNADGQIEMADKTVLLPTTLEKKHSANGFDLLSVMQTAELDVSPHTRNITTHSGGEVVICINGMEAQAEDVATLRAKNIRSIEYIRTPSGKYAGKAGLVNFITYKLDYGCYRRDIWNYGEADGRNINLTVTYSLGYGKKSERGDTDIDKHINSAIMKTY